MLVEHYRGLDSKRRVLCLEGVELSAADIFNITLKAKIFLANLKQKKVALYVQNPLLQIILMLTCDSLARDILLIPGNTELQTLHSMLEDAETEHVLTDDGLNLSPLTAHVEQYQLNVFLEYAAEYSGDSVPQGEASDWILPTSGTTGQPKLVRHSLKNLTVSLKSDKQVGGSYCWGLLYELNRFAGIQVWLQSVLSGSMLVLADLTKPLAHRLDELARHGCNALSATPTLWKKILMCPQSEKLQLKQITMGGEIAEQGTLSAVAKKYPDARVVHIYASTEAGVGFSVTDGVAGFPESYLSDMPGGIEMKLSESGNLLIKKPAFMVSYINNQSQIVGNDEFIDTGDQVVLDNGRVLFLGRQSGVINVGGNKVHPEEVEALISKFDGVKLVAVSSKKSPIMGQLVTALVMVDSKVTDHRKFKADLLSFCKSNLESFKVPALIKITDNIAVNENGKVLRGN